MTPEPIALADAYAAAAAQLRAAPGVLVTAHENPDGDAVGSVVGAVVALRAAGLRADAWITGTVPLPQELAWLGVEDIARGPLPEPAGRTLLALDCGSVRRLGADWEAAAGWPAVVNIDHHHDNTRFGTLDVVDAAAACTAQMVGRLLEALSAPLPPAAALALYVGAVTDTGRFSYANTSPAVLRFAADLVAAGVDPHLVHRRLYEDVPVAKARLLGRALGTLELHAEGRLATAVLTRRDFEEAGAAEPFSEGVIDHLRALAGVRIAALIREPREGAGRYKVSLRAAADDVDVSRIAGSQGGGGHVQAAGFTTDLELPELVAFLAEEAGRA